MWYDISDTYMNNRAESKIFLSMWVSLFEVQELVERLLEKSIEVKAPTLAQYLSELRRKWRLPCPLPTTENRTDAAVDLFSRTSPTKSYNVINRESSQDSDMGGNLRIASLFFNRL